ncbi:hypothetical protein B4Q13_25105, partial [Lacticaseibacillus rhamnosus]
RVGRRGAPARAGRVDPGRLRRRGGGAAKLPEGALRDPEQKYVQNGEEAELERYRDRLGVHRRLLLDVEDEPGRPEGDRCDARHLLGRKTRSQRVRRWAVSSAASSPWSLAREVRRRAGAAWRAGAARPLPRRERQPQQRIR